MTKCKKVGPKGNPCIRERDHALDHEARGPRGGLLERWPVRSEGKPPKPAAALRLASDGTPEIKLSGIPLDVLEAMEAHVTRHKLRGRNALLALCALAGWEALQKKEARRERSA